MELIRISGDKIKISLTKDELEAYDLTVDNIDCTGSEAKKVFREIFIEAREQTGFDTENEKVFVQIFRARGGGCEIFVSKIGAKRSTAPEKDFFVFETLEALIAACRILKSAGYCENSSAYTDGHAFYLILTLPTELDIACAGEWGRREIFPHKAYIREHFKLICENDAIDILSQF